jgi:hypothetical protein
MPYRTLDDRIDGVVITFANITEAKTLEAKLRGDYASLEKHTAKQLPKRAGMTERTPSDGRAPTNGNGKTRRSRKL